MKLCLLPMPRRCRMLGGYLIPRDGAILVPSMLESADALFAASQLQKALARYLQQHWDLRCHIDSPEYHGTVIRLAVAPTSTEGRPESYRLRIQADGVTILGADQAGLFYGVQTLIQIIRLTTEQTESNTAWPLLEIDDYPEFPHRGVMLDISRDKVPSMSTLFALADMLAGWKINQLQLYIEHTFAYSRHREVWATASPMTPEQIVMLDTYCRQRCIELVPNQNSFGHMERWLRLPRYRELAEAPEGADTPWGYRWEGPFSLCPTDPRCLDLLNELYVELLPHFSSGYFNIGGDETFDVGQGRSRAAVDSRGKGRVYLDFLKQLHKIVNRHGRRMMFWGDIILGHPHFIAELPRDLIAMQWGYEADHPFDQEGALFAQSAVPFYVCPGTSSWHSFAGRTDNCLANLLNAAENGAKHGAIGYLNTDWGDNGHHQYLPISYLGLAAGAAYGWSPSVNRSLDIARALDLYAFEDRAQVMGKLALDLGNVYQQLELMPNASPLFCHLVPVKGNKTQPSALSAQQLEAVLAAIDAAVVRLHHAKMDRPDASLIKDEFANTAALLRHGARRGRWMLDRDALATHDLAADLCHIIGEHERLWMARNRPGGLADSTARLWRAHQSYGSQSRNQ